MNAIVLRVICGLLFAGMVLGVVNHPPQDLTQGLGMMLPATMLLGVALKGPKGRSTIPKKRAPPAPPVSGGTPGV
ncbi:hypothetical protein D7Y27_13800 [Corallococcus sp. AB004]|uniref:hypothetical protein n=1 Tax=Corallococcus TaxID=83461 RepID=UPI000EA16604|nr:MULTISPECIES: hypothetical protein [Corallococcus]NRD45850.1 hypothetical protein [Corallococcus exiguus]RKI03744.1 hypothetical protein D7Y04_01900 [Corallococcus sp. AB038B]RKI44457.1 hypothetical protein D7Y27_13800 [Corallococcus sp. AB004]